MFYQLQTLRMTSRHLVTDMSRQNEAKRGPISAVRWLIKNMFELLKMVSYTLGPLIPLNFNCALNISSKYPLALNFDTNRFGSPHFDGNFLDGRDNTGLDLSWTKAFLIIRGCKQCKYQFDPTNDTDVEMVVKSYRYGSQGFTDLTPPFIVSDNGHHTTNTSPIFDLPSLSTLGLQVTTPDAIYWVGNIFIQFVRPLT